MWPMRWQPKLLFQVNLNNFTSFRTILGPGLRCTSVVIHIMEIILKSELCIAWCGKIMSLQDFGDNTEEEDGTDGGPSKLVDLGLPPKKDKNKTMEESIIPKCIPSARHVVSVHYYQLSLHSYTTLSCNSNVPQLSSIDYR